MKKTIQFLLATCLLLVLSISQSNPALAQTSLPPSDINGNIYFRDLGFRETRLISPYQSARILFSFPAELQLSPGGNIVLEYETIVNTSESFLGSPDGWTGTLYVNFNNEEIYSIPLTEGQNESITIPIPDFALVSTRPDGRHEISFDLVADLSCFYDINTNVIIKDTSYLNLPSTAVPPELSLAKLPSPFFTPDGFVQSTAYIVVPDDPTEKELEAALLVSTGFGKLTNGEMDFQLATTSEVTSNLVPVENLIITGLANSMAQFGTEINLELPLQNDGGSFNLLNDDDGVIQLARSPWNNAKTILLVSGNTETGLLKAAQSVSVGSLLVALQPDLVMVSNVQPDLEGGSPITDRTLKDLGYQTETVNNVGSNYLDYFFEATADQLNSKDSFIQIDVSYPQDIIDTTNSIIDLSVNDIAIGSVPFEKVDNNEAQGIQSHRISIPPGLLVPGTNNLEILVELLPANICIVDFSWVTIHESSYIHLATTNPSVSQFFPGSNLYLNTYPDLVFAADYNLNDLAAILPESSPASWNSAAQTFYQIGSDSLLEIPNFTAWYGDSVPDSVKNEKNMLAFGKASILPFIKEVNEYLPAPFEDGSDVPADPGMRVSYRISPEINLGYLELFASPWNPNRFVLAVLGNSDDGIQIAGNMLNDPLLSDELFGNFALSNGNQVISVNTNILVGEERPILEVVPDEDVVVVAPDPQTSDNIVIVDKQPWLVPAIITTSALIVFFAGYSIISAAINRSKNKDQN